MHIVSTLQRYLQTELGVADAERLDSDFALLREGIIDSLDVMRLVDFMEREFGIRVDGTDLMPANFRSLDAMARYVARKQNDR